MVCAWSPFRDFENYLRIVLGLDEDDIHMILRQYNSNFVIYELSLGFYTIKDISEAVYAMGDHKGTLQIEYDDITLKPKPILTRFGSTCGTLNFDEKSFSKILMGFTPFWDYTPTNAVHADTPGEFTGDKILDLSTINKIYIKTNVIDGSIVNGSRQPILISFVLDKPPGYKVFCQTETIHYKKEINLF